MQSPKTKISINKTELTLISSGLKHIVECTARAASNPDLLPASYRKLFSKPMYSMFRKLHAKLAGNSSSEVYLTAVEFAAAIFALRITRKKRLWQDIGLSGTGRLCK